MQQQEQCCTPLHEVAQHSSSSCMHACARAQMTLGAHPKAHAVLSCGCSKHLLLLRARTASAPGCWPCMAAALVAALHSTNTMRHMQASTHPQTTSSRTSMLSHGMGGGLRGGTRRACQVCPAIQRGRKAGAQEVAAGGVVTVLVALGTHAFVSPTQLWQLQR